MVNMGDIVKVLGEPNYQKGSPFSSPTPAEKLLQRPFSAATKILAYKARNFCQ